MWRFHKIKYTTLEEFKRWLYKIPLSIYTPSDVILLHSTVKRSNAVYMEIILGCQVKRSVEVSFKFLDREEVYFMYTFGCYGYDEVTYVDTSCDI